MPRSAEPDEMVGRRAHGAGGDTTQSGLPHQAWVHPLSRMVWERALRQPAQTIPDRSLRRPDGCNP